MTPRPARPGDEQLRRAGPRRDSAPPPSSAHQCRRHRRQAGRRGNRVNDAPARTLCAERPRVTVGTEQPPPRHPPARSPRSACGETEAQEKRGLAPGGGRVEPGALQGFLGRPVLGRTMGTSDKGKGNTERVTGSPWRTGRDERSETRCRRTRLAPSENVLGRDVSRGRRGGLGRKHSAVWRRPQKLKPLPPPQGTVPSLLDGRGCGKRVCWG